MKLIINETESCLSLLVLHEIYAKFDVAVSSQLTTYSSLLYINIKPVLYKVNIDSYYTEINTDTK